MTFHLQVDRGATLSIMSWRARLACNFRHFSREFLKTKVQLLWCLFLLWMRPLVLCTSRGELSFLWRLVGLSFPMAVFSVFNPSPSKSYTYMMSHELSLSMRIIDTTKLFMAVVIIRGNNLLGFYPFLFDITELKDMPLWFPFRSCFSLCVDDL